MNAVEIEEAITLLAEQGFDRDNFPFTCLEAFGNKETTIKRLKSGSSNVSDVEGAILQRNNIHMKVCDEGDVSRCLKILKASSATHENMPENLRHAHEHLYRLFLFPSNGGE